MRILFEYGSLADQVSWDVLYVCVQIWSIDFSEAILCYKQTFVSSTQADLVS